MGDQLVVTNAPELNRRGDVIRCQNRADEDQTTIEGVNQSRMGDEKEPGGTKEDP